MKFLQQTKTKTNTHTPKQKKTEENKRTKNDFKNMFILIDKIKQN